MHTPEASPTPLLKNGRSPAGIRHVEFLTERSVSNRLVRPAPAHPYGVTSEFSRGRRLSRATRRQISVSQATPWPATQMSDGS